MVVKAPRRPRRVDTGREFRESEALREQALIEEARRRARRRRRANALLALAAVTAVAAVAAGFDHGTGAGNPVRNGGSRQAVSSAPAGNGLIALTDGKTLQVMNPDGSDAQVIARCAAGCMVVEPAWSPDGSRLAYIRGRPSRSRWYQAVALWLFVTEPGGGGKARRLGISCICTTRFNERVHWSPDGSQLAFSRDSGQPGEVSLWTIEVDNMRLRRLTDCQARCTDLDPAWAPNGDLIAFTRVDAGGAALYTVHPDGSGLTKITRVRGAVHPQWSPDSGTIAFDAPDGIYVTRVDRSGQKLLFASQRGNGPDVESWSPDGTRLAFFNTPRQGSRFAAEVWTMKADGSDPRRLYHTGCCVETWAAPIWSPDGRQIAFAASSGGGTYVINADGTGLHKISAAHALALAWQRAQ